MFAWYIHGNKNEIAGVSEDETLLWELMYEEFMERFYYRFNYYMNRMNMNMTIKTALKDAKQSTNLEFLEDYVGEVEVIK